LVVGGQSLCLLLTLLAVPVFYSLFDDMKSLPIVHKIFGRRQDAVPSAAPIPQPVQFGIEDRA
jgi:HAE1 family hydrophobic/amphiphilic exporter-1